RVRDKCPARRSIIAPAHSGHGPPRSQDTLTCRGCTARPHNEGESSFLRLSEEGVGMTEIRGSAFVQKLFHTTSYAWVWLLLRLWLGWHWFEAGWHKVDNPNWMENGNALRGFLTRATTIPEGGTSAPAVYEWYRSFLQFLLEGGHYAGFAKLVVFGEILVGIGLII